MIFDEVAPFTTIAWRTCHIIDCLAAPRCGTWLGLEAVPHPLSGGYPGTAKAALDLLEQAYEIWRTYVSAVDEPDLWTKVGPIAGQYADGTRVGFVLHIIDELIHHAAEVSLLRDLYRANGEQDAFIATLLQADRPALEAARAADPGIIAKTIAEHPDLMLRAAAEGRWKAIPLLVELGFSTKGKNGRTPLHHAAAAGDMDNVRLLIELGGDLSERDETYKSTPLEWAEYFGRTNTADYLRSLA